MKPPAFFRASDKGSRVLGWTAAIVVSGAAVSGCASVEEAAWRDPTESFGGTELAFRLLPGDGCPPAAEAEAGRLLPLMLLPKGLRCVPGSSASPWLLEVRLAEREWTKDWEPRRSTVLELSVRGASSDLPLAAVWVSREGEGSVASAFYLSDLLERGAARLAKELDAARRGVGP